MLCLLFSYGRSSINKEDLQGIKKYRKENGYKEGNRITYRHNRDNE